MKSFYLLICATLLTGTTMAQEFFNETSYRGAFGGPDAADWTAGWVNWNPQATVYPDTTRSVRGDITTDQTWGASEVISLQNFVFIRNNATLTIEAGCVIRGDKNSKATLIVAQDGMINAVGTAEKPIVFTSAFAANQRAAGDWGGIIILGEAPTNRPPGSAFVEGGLTPKDFTGYGGTKADDSSGRLSYVRIEYAGVPFTTDNEINSLTMGGVGSGTQIDHVQCSYGGDDSFEWFGGTVNAKYLIAYGGVDDDFDTDFGYRGYVQFALGVRDPSVADAAGDSNGFESDNDGEGSDGTPQTGAIFSNVTLVGPQGLVGAGGTVNDRYGRGLRLRRNTALSLFNSVVMDWRPALRLDDASTRANVTEGDLVISNNLFAAADSRVLADSATRSVLTLTATDTLPNAAGLMLVKPYGDLGMIPLINPDFRLMAGSPALTGASFADAKFNGLVTDIAPQLFEQAAVAVRLYPNPATYGTRLVMDLRQRGDVAVSLHDLTGRLVRRVATLRAAEGEHTVDVNTADLQNGLYLVRITTARGVATQRLTVQK